MANGLCPYVLLNIADVAKGNSPGRKVRVAGMLQMLMCCQDSAASILNEAFVNGHNRPIQVKYRPRTLTSLVQSEVDCDINVRPTYSEFTVPSLSHKQISFFLPDDLVRTYCSDVSATRPVGTPPTSVMKEVYDMFVEHANTLLGSVNADVVTSMATKFGLNKGSGSTLTYLNINSNGDTLNVNNGVISIMRDIQENEVCGDVCLVGGGIWSGYNMAQAAMCCNAAGLNLGGISLPAFYFDKDSQTIWGTNQIGVFAKDSVKFIGPNKYVGPAWAGFKGGSEFTTMRFPVEEFNGCNTECLNELTFDVQFKYIDCAGSYTVNGTPTTLGPGWIVIIGKDYFLYAQPTTLWDAADPLTGTNGTWKYKVDNSTYAGGAYGAYAGY